MGNVEDGLTASLEHDGNMTDIRDLLIASIALVNGFGVLTNNVGHFNKIKHLRVVSGKVNYKTKRE